MLECVSKQGEGGWCSELGPVQLEAATLRLNATKRLGLGFGHPEAVMPFHPQGSHEPKRCGNLSV